MWSASASSWGKGMSSQIASVLDVDELARRAR
jgi:hypothetical protein